MPIERMLREPIGLGCATGASQLVSRAMAWSRGKGSADGGGSSSAPWVSYTAFADYVYDMSGEQTSTRRSFHLPARSSVGDMLNGFVRCSKAGDLVKHLRDYAACQVSASGRPPSSQGSSPLSGSVGGSLLDVVVDDRTEMPGVQIVLDEAVLRAQL